MGSEAGPSPPSLNVWTRMIKSSSFSGRVSSAVELPVVIVFTSLCLCLQYESWMKKGRHNLNMHSWSPSVHSAISRALINMLSQRNSLDSLWRLTLIPLPPPAPSTETAESQLGSNQYSAVAGLALHNIKSIYLYVSTQKQITVSSVNWNYHNTISDCFQEW